MRTTPTTVTIYNGSTGATGTWTDGGAGSPATVANLTGASNIVFYTSGGAGSSTVFGHFTAAAEL
jgi:hypothetical protein